MRFVILALAALATALSAQDGWGTMSGIDPRPESWRGQSVKLTADGDALVMRHEGNGNGFALPRAARFRRELAVEATVTMRKRLLSSGWNFAGVALYQDGANFWMLSLVEGPDGKHSVDFIECHGGTWQAQNAPGTALERTGNAYYDWQTGTAYRLRLAFVGERIVGTVSNAAGNQQLAQASYSLAKEPAVRAGMPSLIARGSEAAFASFQATAPTQSNTPAGIKIMDGKLGRIAFFDEPLRGTDQEANRRLARVLTLAGFGVTHLSADQITRDGLLSAPRFQLLIIPNCRSFPVMAGEAVQQFTREGGHVIFIGGPFLDNPLYRISGQWLDRTGLAKLKSEVKTAHRPFAITPQLDLSGWERSCRDRNTESQFRVVPEGPDGTPCLRLDIADYVGWDGRLSPVLDGIYGAGDDFLTFLGKGDARTPQVAVEVQEADGSRWIATASLTTGWRRIGLAVDDFRYWPDSKTKGKRGQAGDHLHPDQAARINFGLASTHTTAIGGGAHTFWIADLGSAENPIGSATGMVSTLTGSIPTIYPRYKVFPLPGPAKLSAPRMGPIPGESHAGVRSLGTPRDLVCGIPRTTGTGFAREHKWRFVSLLKASLANNPKISGDCEWFVLNQELPLDGVVLAGFGYNEPSQWRDSSFLSRVTQLAKFLRQGAMLEDAGTEQLAYWPGEEVRLGVRLRTFAQDSPKAEIRLEIQQGTRGVWRKQTSQPLSPGRSELAFTWQPPAEPALYTVRAILSDGKGTVFGDRIEHEFAVLDPKPAPKSEFITVHDGDFWLKGEKWYPVGINYWPLYVSGMDHGDYWAGWLRDRYYEPNLVELDLAQMADMGINMVSIQSPPTEFYRNLLDFARRCKNHGIHINLYNGLASPLGFNDRGLQEYLTAARLPGNPVVFAYDTIWEPGNHVFRNDAARGKWDAEWRAWLAERYGSVGNAETDWQYQARRNDRGEVISPPDRCFREDGPWRRMMAAYRRFMDDLTSRLWGKAHRRLRELDPNHLISYRQGNTLPYDFALSGTGKHIDFICPEGYAIPHSDTGENAIGFITRYVDYTTGGKPVVWSEFGKSVWNRQAMAPDPEAIKMVGEYHARFYRAALASGANGTVPWWWPGGYRVGERSDFGIVGPDRDERPAALLIRQYAPQLKHPRPRPTPNTWLDYDRDANAGGYWWTAFHEGADAYRTAAEQGEVLGIRTKGTGTDSANTPLLAVGDVPCNGHNPPKFLNAEFNHLQIQAADGNWVEATDGAQIPVKTGQPIRARVSLGNLQEATWLPGENKGSVALVVHTGETQAAAIPVPKPVPYLADADFGVVVLLPQITGTTKLHVRLEALGRTPFGEARTFTLLPAND
jgi:hypothetical protein